MKINKDLKSAVIRPTANYLQKTSTFLNYRATAFQNFSEQLILGREQDENHQLNSKDRINNENVSAMKRIIRQKSLFQCPDSANRNLCNLLSGEVATVQQAHDMLSFREKV